MKPASGPHYRRVIIGTGTLERAVKAGARDLAGKVLFGALFAVVLPLVLALWASELDKSVGWPVPQWDRFSAVLLAIGSALMLTGMASLRVQGLGLPMSAFPPTRLVTRGAYGFFRHPIYLGAGLIAFGLSLLAGSPGGLYVVTPLFILAMAAYVVGFEEPTLNARFGTSRQSHQALLALPGAETPASFASKLTTGLAILAVWILTGYLLDYARCEGTCTGAFMNVKSGSAAGWPEMIWTAFPAMFFVWLVAARTGRQARSAAIAGICAVTLGLYLYGVLPALGYDHRSNTWGLLPVAFAVTFVAWNHRPFWKALRWLAEKVANSRHDWLFFGGRFRIINHGVYSGLAGAAGVYVAGAILGNGMAAVILGGFVLLGAALFAQALWSSPTLMRPFGYWGAVLGAVAALAVLHLMFDIRFATIAVASSIGATFVQAAGRLRCLVQGCCHGIETTPELGIKVWQPQSRVVAQSGLGGRHILVTQLFSIIFNCLLGPLLLALYLSRSVDSTFIVGLYLILTGTERFAEDAFRGEKQTRWAGPLRENQWIALAALFAGIFTTLIPAGRPSPPDAAIDLTFVAAIVLGALMAAFATSMDFPKSRRRYSRLSG